MPGDGHRHRQGLPAPHVGITHDAWIMRGRIGDSLRARRGGDGKSTRYRFCPGSGEKQPTRGRQIQSFELVLVVVVVTRQVDIDGGVAAMGVRVGLPQIRGGRGGPEAEVVGRGRGVGGGGRE